MIHHSNHQRIIVHVILLLALVATALTAHPATSTTLLAGTLVPVQASDGAEGDLFGNDVVLDGDLMAVSASAATIGTAGGAGAVYLYQRDPGAPSGWTEIKKLSVEQPEVTETFGASLALRGDVLAVGATGRNVGANSEVGVVYLYERDQGGPNNWGFRKTISEPLAGFSYFGSDVALADDLLVVGARSAYRIRGAVFLYDRDDDWALHKELRDPDGVIADYFGDAVAIDDDTLVVGQPMRTGNPRPDNSGAALVFERDQGGPDAWGQVARLVADAPEPDMNFGETLTLDGDTVVVGAIGASGSGSTPVPQTGAAFVFERGEGGPNAWGMTKRLAADVDATGDHYGSALALAGDDIWVGAPLADGGNFSTQGKVYHYRRDQGGPGAWGGAARVEAKDGILGDGFGSSLAVDGAAVVVGAIGRDGGRGAVYVEGEATTPTPTPSLTKVYLPYIGNDTFAATGTLLDGGTVAATTGALLGAATGTVDAPVDVRVVTTVPPAILPDAVTVRGEYHAVAAERPLVTPVATPLLMGLPVPDGANPDDLALAVLVPAEQIEDGADEGPTWITVPGRYDADDDLFVVTIGSLVPDDMPVVLVEHPSFEPLPLPTDNLRADAPAQTARFQVECAADASTEICTDTARVTVTAELEDAYTTFVSIHDFHEPRLITSTGSFEDANEPTHGQLTAFHGITIITNACDSIKGMYIPGEFTMQICMSAKTTDEDIRHTVRHELFHAIQKAYPVMAQEYVNENERERSAWTREGTAAAAERSSFTMQENFNYQPHSVSDSLLDTTDVREYRAQDFWVYVGLERGESIRYLQAVFEAGGTPEQVGSVLNLQDLYWGWAKNQAFEKKHVIQDIMEVVPCAPDTLLIGTLIVATWPDDASAGVSLPPMTSRVVEFSFSRTMELGVLAVTSSGGDAVRYKLYPSRDTLDPDCATNPDGDSTENVGLFFPRHKLYVLISNTSPTDTHTFGVALQGG